MNLLRSLTKEEIEIVFKKLDRLPIFNGDILPPLDSEAALKLGVYYQNNNNLEKAIFFLNYVIDRFNDKEYITFLHSEGDRLYEESHIETICSNAAYDLGMIHSDRTSLYYDFNKAIKYFEIAASKNDIDGLTAIGNLYYQHKQDFKKAYDYFLRAAKNNDPAAQNSLGRMYEFGLGVDSNLTKAKFWYELAVSQGDELATENLLRLNGNDKISKNGSWKSKEYVEVPKDPQKAIAMEYVDNMLLLQQCTDQTLLKNELEKLEDYANNGQEFAYILLFEFYFRNKRFRKAFEIAERGADLGMSEMIHQLANLYLGEHGIKRNAKKAWNLLKEAEQKGNKNVLYSIANCYRGEYNIVKINTKKAFDYCKKAAEAGVEKAQYVLARYYFNGIGTAKNDNEALEWLLKAAENNSEKAKKLVGLSIAKARQERNINLNHLSYPGWYVELMHNEKSELDDSAIEDPKIYFRETLIFAKNHNPEACYRLARCYEDGIGIISNPRQALTWMSRSASLGFGEAFIGLHQYYSKGFGTAVDLKIAKQVLAQGAELYYEKAVELYNKFYGDTYRMPELNYQNKVK